MYLCISIILLVVFIVSSIVTGTYTFILLVCSGLFAIAGSINSGLKTLAEELNITAKTLVIFKEFQKLKDDPEKIKRAGFKIDELLDELRDFTGQTHE